MEDGTPRDQSPTDSLSPIAPPDVANGGLIIPTSEVAPAVARPLRSRQTKDRSLRDFDILLYPLSPGQAIADVVLILFLAFVCDLLIGFVGGFIVASMYDLPLDGLLDLPPHIRKEMLFPLLALRATTTVGLVVAFLWSHGQSPRAIGLRAPGLALDNILGVALTVVIYGLILATLGLLAVVWPDVIKQMQENAAGLLEMIPNATPLVFLLMAMTIGVYEEVLFRGFIMPRLRRATGSWIAAVILSSAVFTALHAMEQTPAALIIVGILSVSFSLVTIWRRSIVPAIIAHALFDFSQFLLLMYQQPGP